MMHVLDRSEAAFEYFEATGTRSPDIEDDTWERERARVSEPTDTKAALTSFCLRPERPLWALAHYAAQYNVKGSDDELRIKEICTTFNGARRNLDDLIATLLQDTAELSAPVSLSRWAKTCFARADIPDVLRRDCVESWIFHLLEPTDPYHPDATSRSKEERSALSTLESPASWLLKVRRPEDYERIRTEAKAVLTDACQSEDPPSELLTLACFFYHFAQRARFDFGNRFLILDKDPLLACARLRQLTTPTCRRPGVACVVEVGHVYYLFDPPNTLRELVGVSDLCTAVAFWMQDSLRRNGGQIARGVCLMDLFNEISTA